MNPSFYKFRQIITNPIKFRFFLFTKLPAAFFAGLRIHHFDANTCVVRIRYSWFSMNPFKSIYFAVEAMDCRVHDDVRLGLGRVKFSQT